MIKIYTDGACSVNPGIGGWGAIIIFDSGEEKEISGSELETTNNRMEITAVIKSLELKELNIEDKVKIYSDSTYVINTITKNWKRNTNNDLWGKLDNLLEKRIVIFSGGPAKGRKEILDEIQEIANGGGFGSIVGRNSFQRPFDEGLSLMREIMDIYKSA